MGDRYVTRARRIDPFTVVRKRVVLSPDTCKICGFSVCRKNNLGPFEHLDPKTKARVKDALKAHRKLAHPIHDKPVVNEEELPTMWLGGQPDANENIDKSNVVSEGWVVDKRLDVEGD